MINFGLVNIGSAVIDILFITAIAYVVYRLIKNTRAIPVLSGFLLVFFVFVVAQWLNLETLEWLFEKTSSYVIIAILLILQPELRKMFYRMGVLRWMPKTPNIDSDRLIIIEEAVQYFQAHKIGALLVLTNTEEVYEIIEMGIKLRAKLSVELLISIFYPGNPLHDGAVCIDNEGIVSAANFLPLSNSILLSSTHGSRHRAGLGVSEEADVLVIIVSEETGTLSLAYSGKLRLRVSPKLLHSTLNHFHEHTLKERWATLVPNAYQPIGIEEDNE